MWKMLEAAGFNVIYQVMPTANLAPQFQNEEFVQFAATRARYATY